MSVDLYYYSEMFGEGLRGFWPQEGSEDSFDNTVITVH